MQRSQSLSLSDTDVSLKARMTEIVPQLNDSGTICMLERGVTGGLCTVKDTSKLFVLRIFKICNQGGKIPKTGEMRNTLNDIVIPPPNRFERCLTCLRLFAKPYRSTDVLRQYCSNIATTSSSPEPALTLRSLPVTIIAPPLVRRPWYPEA